MHLQGYLSNYKYQFMKTSPIGQDRNREIQNKQMNTDELHEDESQTINIQDVTRQNIDFDESYIRPKGGGAGAHPQNDDLDSELDMQSDVESVALSQFQTLEIKQFTLKLGESAHQLNATNAVNTVNKQEQQTLSVNQQRPQKVPSPQMSALLRQNCLRLSTIEENIDIGGGMNMHSSQFDSADPFGGRIQSHQVEDQHLVKDGHDFIYLHTIPDESIHIDQMAGLGDSNTVGPKRGDSEHQATTIFHNTVNWGTSPANQDILKLQKPALRMPETGNTSNYSHTENSQMNQHESQQHRDSSSSQRPQEHGLHITANQIVIIEQPASPTQYHYGKHEDSNHKPSSPEAQPQKDLSRKIAAASQGKTNLPELNGEQAIKKHTAELNESVHMNPSGLWVAPSYSQLESGPDHTSKQDPNQESGVHRATNLGQKHPDNYALQAHRPLLSATSNPNNQASLHYHQHHQHLNDGQISSSIKLLRDAEGGSEQVHMEPQNYRQQEFSLGGVQKINVGGSYDHKPIQKNTFGGRFGNPDTLNSQQDQGATLWVGPVNHPEHSGPIKILKHQQNNQTSNVCGSTLMIGGSKKQQQSTGTLNYKNFKAKKTTRALRDETEHSKLGLDYDDDQIGLSDVELEKSSKDESSSWDDQTPKRRRIDSKNAKAPLPEEVVNNEKSQLCEIINQSKQKVAESDDVIRIDLAPAQKVEDDLSPIGEEPKGDSASTSKKLLDPDCQPKDTSDNNVAPQDMAKSTAVDEMSGSKTSSQMRKLITTHQLKSFDKSSMFLFSQDSDIRIWICIILKSVYFESFMLLMVISNCVILGVYEVIREKNIASHDHATNVQYDSYLARIDAANIFFTFLYLFESLMKGVMKGVIVHQKSYLRTGWSWIDVGLILQGLVELVIPPKASLAVRAIRCVFRPLKCINVMPSVKQLLQSLIGSLPEFGNVAIFMIFVFVLFATMGLQQYNGSTYNSCRLQRMPNEKSQGEFVWESDLSFQRACSKSDVGNFVCPNGLYCGNPEEYPDIHLQDEDYRDRLYINFGVTSFDNLLTSLLTVFQMITSETWYTQIVNTMDLDIPVIGAVYCFGVIIVGQFFLLNLILAVMIEAFKKSHELRLQEALTLLENEQAQYEPGSEEFDQEEYDQEFDDQQPADENEVDNGEPIQHVNESGGAGQSDERPPQNGEDIVFRQSVTQFLKHQPNSIDRNTPGSDSTLMSRSKTLAAPIKTRFGGSAMISMQEAEMNVGEKIDQVEIKEAFRTGLDTKRDAKGVFRTGVKKLLGKKESSKNLPMVSDGRMTFAGAASAMMKKSQTIRGSNRGGNLSGQGQQVAPVTPAKKMADLVGHSKHIKDEEKKYEQEQDFSVFMKELVLKRRVVNMFMKAGTKKSMFERVSEMANKAQQNKDFEEKLKKVEMEQQKEVKMKSSNKSLPKFPPKPSNLANFPRPAIIVEEMKDEEIENRRTSKIGKDSSTNIYPKKSGQMGLSTFSKPQKNPSNQLSDIFENALDREAPFRDVKVSPNPLGLHDDFNLKNKDEKMGNLLEMHAVSKHFMRKQTVVKDQQPTVQQVVQHMLQNPKVLKQGLQKFQTRQIEDEFVQQFQSNAVKSSIKIQKKKRKKSKKGADVEGSSMIGPAAENRTMKSGIQRDKMTFMDIMEDEQQDAKTLGTMAIRAAQDLNLSIGNKSALKKIGTTQIENFGINAAATDKLKIDKREGNLEEQNHEEEEPTGDAEANRVLKVLMVNFGASIRQKILKMQEEAKRQDSIRDRRRESSKVIDLCIRLTENNFWFSASVIAVVLGSEVVIASDQYPISMERTLTMEYLNILVTLLFALELAIRLTASGFENFVKVTKLNIMDAFIVVVSILDVLISTIFLSHDQLINSAAITVLRATRTIRFFKLARYWKSFRVLLENLIETLQNIKIFAVLLIIFLYIYTILGMEFFAHQARMNLSSYALDPENGVSPPYHFDNLMQAFFTTFVVFTNDGQSLIYYNFYRAVSPTLATIWWISFVILTQKVLLNLFLAILLEKFEEADSRHKIIDEQTQNQLENQESIRPKNKFEIFVDKVKAGYGNFLMKIKQPSSPTKQEEMQQTTDMRMMKSLTRELAAIYNQMKEQDQPVQGRSLGFIGRESRLRHFLYKLVSHPKYDAMIVVCILISAVLLALDAPTLHPQSSTKKAIFWIDLVTIIIFTLECLAKIVTYGFFFNGKFSYLRGMWNILDFIILIFSFLCLTSLAETFRVVKTFRILRCLRLIGRNEGLKVAVRALLFAIPNILQITIIMFLFHSIFAVIAMSYFKGKSNICTNFITVLEKAKQVGDETIHHDDAGHQLPSKWACMDQGGLWSNRLYNFDNIMNSLITLFVMSTTAGWSDIVVQTISAEDEFDMMGNDHVKRPAEWTLFFMFYMIVAHFFFLNLFIVVVISTFKSEQNRVGGGDLLTNKQKEWIDLRLLILRSQPIKKLKEPSQNWKKFFYKIQCHPQFEKVIQIAIILNTCTLMIKWYRQPPEVDVVTEIINKVFTVIFISEAAIRIIGIGIRNYLKDGWNIFDFIVALGSLVSILISSSTSVEIKAVSLLRAFRILRLLRLLKRGGKSLYLIFNTFVITMQSLANIGGLLLLMMYIYSIIGMIYFGEVKRNSTMNDYINFESFTSAFITLFTVATVDSWNYTMISFSYVLSPANQCVELPTYADYEANGYKMMGCGNSQNTFAFFISFMFLVSLVFLKLFIAIILEGYKETQTQDGRLFNDDMNQRFREVWAEYDPEATTFIILKDLRPFLFDLGAPLGFDDSFHESRFLQDKFIASLELPTYHNFQSYQFLDILDALSFRLMVLDHINKLHVENEEQKALRSASLRSNASGQGNAGAHQKLFEIDEKEIKGKIEQEVNRLLYQKQSDNIVAFKELWEKEQKKKQNREKNKDVSGLTSSHHMALEMVIRKIKINLHERRELRRLAAEQAEAHRKQLEEEKRQRKVKEDLDLFNGDPNTSRHLLLNQSNAMIGGKDSDQKQPDQSQQKLGFFKRFTKKMSIMSGKPE